MPKLPICLISFLFIIAGCQQPRENIKFRSLENVSLSLKEGSLFVTADAVFYNPNRLKMKLKGLNLDVKLDNKRSALINQKLNVKIQPESVFRAPIEAQLTFEDGLIGSFKSLFLRKSYNLQFIGWVKVSVYGMRLKIPVDHSEVVKR